MANRGLLDVELPEDKGRDDTGSNRIPIIRNRDWKETGSFTFWLHINPDGEEAIRPTHRAVGRFPTMVEHDGRSWLSIGESYVLPDDVPSSLGQKRFRRKADREAGRLAFPFWYTIYDRTAGGFTNTPKYQTVSPHWLVYHAVADAIENGDLDVDTPVFHWDYTDKDGKAQTMTWRAGELLGRLVYGSDADYRKCLAPAYESVLLVVDNEHLDRGPQLLITTSMLAGGTPKKSREPGFSPKLGKLWMAIDNDMRQIEADNERLAKKGRTPVDLRTADPYISPYPLTLSYIENAPTPTDTYSVSSLRIQAGSGGLYEPDDEILAAIQSPVRPEDVEFAFRPRRGDLERLHRAMRDAAESARCDYILSRLDDIFQPWADSMGGSAGSGTAGASAPLFCESCGLGVESTWAECPGCDETLSGDQPPPDIEELMDTGTQRCVCAHIYDLTTRNCPECNAPSRHFLEPLSVGY